MKNQEVAELLTKMADLMEIKGEMVFKVVAMRRAAQAIETMPDDIEKLYMQGDLDDIPGVGEGIAKKIADYLENGKSKYLKRLKKGLPPGLEKLLELEGIGPKKVKMFYEKLHVRNVGDLERAVKQGKLRKLPGIKEKTEANILRSIESSKRRTGRLLLLQALNTSNEIIQRLKCREIKRIDVAGSMRRMKETIGDIDILVTSDKPSIVIKKFTSMEDVSHIIGKGPTKASVVLDSGIQVDLRVLRDSEYGSALMYFTGSKEHNVELRRVAISKGMKLSEYGLFKGKKVAGRTEQEIYSKLGMSYIPPEMRENRGEIELAQKKRIPRLLEIGDITGDLHTHTNWSDGKDTIENMSAAAKKLGYEYICISDHFNTLPIANPLDMKRFEAQYREIEKIRRKSNITILQGAEIDIKSDGSLSVPNDILKKMDVVMASLHTAIRKENTKRVIAAMENENVDVIAHLTGRLMNVREGADLDIPKILEKAKETGTALEINSQPQRMDLNDTGSMAAIKAGCKLIINTDAHSTEQLKNMVLGVSVARRAWATRKDIINTNNLQKFRKLLK